jgi:gamma-glutamyltranspeptidase
VLQNRGSFFSLDEEHHNRLEPGKRTFHTLIPAMVLSDDGSPYAALGTMGGEGQPQTQVAMLTRMVDFGYDVQQAIEAPRWLMGHTWGAPSRDLWLEGRIPDPVVHELERLGQPVKMLADWDEDVGTPRRSGSAPTATSRAVPTPVATAPHSGSEPPR